MDTKEFLQSVITTDAGYLELAIRTAEKQWQPYFYEWPQQVDLVLEHAASCQDDCDVYFSAHLFKSKDSHKDNVLPTRTIQQDLDEADVGSLPLQTTILNETSPSRHQGFWILNDEVEPHHLDSLSKRLAYSIPRCDRSGWPIGHKYRLPGTINHKYLIPHIVNIKQTSNHIYSIEDIELLPDIELPSTQVDAELEFVTNPPVNYPTGPYELVESIKDKLTSKVYAEYQAAEPSSDRSRSLYALMVQCFKAGLSREEVYWIVYNSANNKFKQDLRFNADRELAKDVIRASNAVKTLALNIRELINDVRKNTKLLVSERRRAIYDIVVTAMRAEGDFISTQDGRSYYILRDQGQPMGIGELSRPLAALLDRRYGLNKMEPEHTHVINSLISYATELPETSIVGSLSHYDQQNTQILIHTGRKSVIKITPKDIITANNGTDNVIFLWDRIVEPFTPDLHSNIDWAELMFGNIPNVVNISPGQAKVLLKVWTLFALMRKAANARPILGLFGQPGAAKTTIARKLYAFFYGRTIDISGVTNPANFDIATATLPLLVLDGVDTWERWLPDRLSQAAGNTDVIVRKLYSDAQIIRLKRQAMIVVTAHDPKFGRADISDRMLILSLLRFENMTPPIPFAAERPIIEEVLQNRGKLWGAVIHDLQRILQTPPLLSTDLQLRVQDFARLGEWIAIATDCQEEFRDAVVSLREAQRTFNLDEESILVNTLQKWLAMTNCNPSPKTEAQLYQELLSTVPQGDLHQFTWAYKSSAHLSRRLSTLQSTLNQIMTLEFSTNKMGQRLWLIKCREDE